jgi:hypothetical protein
MSILECLENTLFSAFMDKMSMGSTANVGKKEKNSVRFMDSHHSQYQKLHITHSLHFIYLDMLLRPPRLCFPVDEEMALLIVLLAIISSSALYQCVENS